MWNLGLALYFLTLPGYALLLRHLMRKGIWREFPAFSAWLGARCLISLALFPVLAFGYRNAYAQGYWWAKLGATVLLGAAIGELFQKRNTGAVAGLAVTVLLLAQSLWTRWLLDFDRSLAVSGALALMAMHRAVDFYAAGLCGWKIRPALGLRPVDPDMRAWGLLIVLMFGGATLDPVLVGNSEPARFLATAGMLAAQFFWLRWLSRQPRVLRFGSGSTTRSLNSRARSMSA